MGQQRPLTWLITGCSTGFGRELARAVVARGYRAVVTARNTAQVEDVVAGHGDRAVALPLDVTNPAQVAETVRRAEERFGGIDVLVCLPPEKCSAVPNEKCSAHGQVT